MKQGGDILQEQPTKQTNVLLVYGSPTPPGRIYSLIDYLNDSLKNNDDISCQLIKPKAIEDHPAYQYWEHNDLSAVEKADGIIITSPVYRASIPAILKQLFDELPVKALYSKPVSLIAVGNVQSHYLGVERHICDILTWFGALYIPTTFYMKAPQLNEGITDNVKDDLDQFLTSHLNMCRVMQNTQLKPIPLAKKHGR